MAGVIIVPLDSVNLDWKKIKYELEFSMCKGKSE